MLQVPTFWSRLELIWLTSRLKLHFCQKSPGVNGLHVSTAVHVAPKLLVSFRSKFQLGETLPEICYGLIEFVLFSCLSTVSVNPFKLQCCSKPFQAVVFHIHKFTF